MATYIRPKDLDPGTPNSTASIPFDNGTRVLKATPAGIVNAATPLATQQQAEDGDGNSNRMSALRVKQAIYKQVFGVFSSTAGGDLIGMPAGGTLTQFSASRQREVWVTDYPFLADPTGATDAAPAFRAARDYIVSIGGGVIRIPPSSVFAFSSTETVQVWEVGALADRVTFLALPTGVSLEGAGRTTSKIQWSGGGVAVAILPLDPANQSIGGFEMQGPGGSNNNCHGILTYPSADYSHVMERVSFHDLYIHDVGSYGLGNTLACAGVTVRGVKTYNTGSDGVDWKQRLDDLGDYDSYPTFFSDIDIEMFGQRTGAGTPTGAGFRGVVQVDRISVKGIPTGIAGIAFVAGIVSGDDIRPSASMSTITNWYAEGADPKGDAIGLEVAACSAVRVGVGTAKWASVIGSTITATPYGWEDGALFEGVTVIPAHGRTAFLATARGTHFRGARVISDKAYFDSRRGNLTVGQTVLPLPYPSTTNNAAPRYVLKINGTTRTTLTETTDYSWTTDSVTLVAAAASGDQFVVVFAPARGFRIEADNCSVDAVQDAYVSSRFSIATQANIDSGTFSIVWEGRGNVGELNDANILAIKASDPSATHKSLRLTGQGSQSAVEIVRAALLNAPTSSAGLASGRIWYDPAASNVLKIVP